MVFSSRHLQRFGALGLKWKLLWNYSTVNLYRDTGAGKRQPVTSSVVKGKWNQLIHPPPPPPWVASGLLVRVTWECTTCLTSREAACIMDGHYCTWHSWALNIISSSYFRHLSFQQRAWVPLGMAGMRNSMTKNLVLPCSQSRISHNHPLSVPVAFLEELREGFALWPSVSTHPATPMQEALQTHPDTCDNRDKSDGHRIKAKWWGNAVKGRQRETKRERSRWVFWARGTNNATYLLQIFT